MNETGKLPFGNKGRLSLDYTLQEGKISITGIHSLRIMTLHRIIGQGAEILDATKP